MREEYTEWLRVGGGIIKYIIFWNRFQFLQPVKQFIYTENPILLEERYKMDHSDTYAI